MLHNIFRPTLQVGILAPIHEPLPGVSGSDENVGYGGTERVVSCLTKGLLDLGVKVHLFAAGNSSQEMQTLSHFYPTVPQSLRQSPRYANDIAGREVATTVTGLNAMRQAQALGVDVIHNHMGPGPLLVALLEGLKVPILTTVHGDLHSPAEECVHTHELVQGTPVVTVSKSQQTLPLNYVGVVHNPIPTEIYTPRFEHGTHLVWIGRFSPEKRPHIAIDAAVRAKRPIMLAGKREVNESGYWETCIKPRLQEHSDLVQYVGEVNDREKNDLLRNAYAFLMPINWQEPFGLVVGEALACGTPVIATNMASMPELVIDDKTGYLVDDIGNEDVLVEQFAHRIGLVGSLNRRHCREFVEQNFSVTRCASQYLAIYRQLLRTHARRVATAR